MQQTFDTSPLVEHEFQIINRQTMRSLLIMIDGLFDYCCRLGKLGDVVVIFMFISIPYFLYLVSIDHFWAFS